jgi:hypothetical protein
MQRGSFAWKQFHLCYYYTCFSENRQPDTKFVQSECCRECRPVDKIANDGVLTQDTNRGKVCWPFNTMVSQYCNFKILATPSLRDCGLKQSFWANYLFLTSQETPLLCVNNATRQTKQALTAYEPTRTRQTRGWGRYYFTTVTCRSLVLRYRIEGRGTRWYFRWDILYVCYFLS